MFGKACARTLLRVAATVLLTATLAGCMGWMPGRQAYWDAKVREMCEKDGGVRIFEVVEIPARNYESRLNSLGNFDIPLDDAKAGDAPFVHRVKRTYIREANPSVWKHELMVIRRSDQKVLGVQVTYSRVGGDFPSPAHRSSFSCPEQAIDLFSVVIKQKKAEEK